MSIKILDIDTINKISAGEVIDNAASVVKELVENSIDAKAKTIKISVIDGGLTEIKVTDDGIGISKDDIKNAFREHATSKLGFIEDLNDIRTFGFRGEALPSIAAVSDVEIISKSIDSKELYGYRYELKSGQDLDEVAANNGTIISVKKLFSNVPVRKKFIKDITKESSYIIDIVSKFAMSHTNISFILEIDDKLKLKTKGDGNLKSIIYELYGRDVYDNLIEVNDTKQGISVTGVIAKPIIARNNKNEEIYFVNYRFIKNKTISKAIENAYDGYLMQHKFPFVCLNISIQGDKVDINVHPKKLEVRFSDDTNVGYSIYEIIQKALKKVNLFHEEKLIYSEDDDLFNDETFESNSKINANFNNETLESKSEINEKSYLNEDAIENNKKNDIYNTLDELPSLSQILNKKLQTGFSIDNFNNNFKNIDSSFNARKKIEDIKIIESNIVENYKYIGQVFKTYILFEYDNKLYILDQHAAHEKINFEKIMSQYKNGKVYSQKIFPSIIIRLNSIEYAAITDNLDEFSKAGFEIEIFGDKDIKVDAVPYDIFNIASSNLLMEMIDSFVDTSNKEEYDSIVEKIASISCKKSIKANHELNEIEARELIKKLLTLENPYNCPHGRPTIITLSKTEFEKKFGRIVS